LRFRWTFPVVITRSGGPAPSTGRRSGRVPAAHTSSPAAPLPPSRKPPMDREVSCIFGCEGREVQEGWASLTRVRPGRRTCHPGGRSAHHGLSRPTTILNYTTSCDLTTPRPCWIEVEGDHRVGRCRKSATPSDGVLTGRWPVDPSLVRMALSTTERTASCSSPSPRGCVGKRTDSAVRRMVDAVGARSPLAPDGRRCWG
jgi:hypothetical protein